MFRASLYITACSAKNRLRRFLIRLREPRYLLGALVGVGYIVFTLYLRGRTSRASGDSTQSQATRYRRLPQGVLATFVAFVYAAPTLAGALLFYLAAACWFLPTTTTLLEFTAAEVQFLFPAPASRRELALHRLTRSQLGLLLAATVSALLFSSGPTVIALRIVVGIWILLVTARTYIAAVSLVRARLNADEAFRLSPVVYGAVVVLVAIVSAAYARALAQGPDSAVETLNRMGTLPLAGVSGVVLWPFVALVRPLFSEGLARYLAAVPGALVVMAASIASMLACDEAFHDWANPTGEGQQRRRARAGRTYGRQTMGWRLALVGRPEFVFVWKCAMQMVRAIDRRTLFQCLRLSAVLLIVVASMTRTRGLAAVIGLLATFATMFAVVAGPLVLRLDLRQDLGRLELIKSWPVRPAVVVRGEMMWPSIFLTVVAWVCIILAWSFSAAVFPQMPSMQRLSIAIAAVVMTPALVAGQYAIHNAAALLFPAWVQVGRPRGLDAMGQRLIALGGTLLTLGVLVLPGAIGGGIVALAVYRWTGWLALAPAALACSTIVAIELLFATEALGPAYEQVDLLSVERRE